MKLAEQYEQNEQYEEAYVEYKKELMHKNDDIELFTKLAHIAGILEKKEEAKAYYCRILELDPPNILAHEQLIDIYVHEDKFKYYLLRGNLHALQQQLSYAKSDYKKAIEHAKDQAEALPARYLYAGLAEGQEKYQEAIDEYLRIADFDEKNPIVFIKLAELYEKTEGLTSAISILEKGYKENGFKDFEEILAGYYIRNSQPDKSLNLTKNELTKSRALMDLGKNDEAFEILKRVESQFSNQPIFHSLLAQYYFQKGLMEDAFKEIDEYAKLDSNSPLIYQMRALIYESMQDSFNEHLNWAKFNNLKGNKDIALNEYLMAYQFNNKDIDLIETIAIEFEKQKELTKSCEFYEKLLAIDTKNSNALQKLAQFRESIGDYSGAYEYLIQLKNIDSRNKFVNENYELYKDKAENGVGFFSFLKNLFSSKMN